MEVEVPVPPPFDAGWIWSFLGARAVPGLEEVVEGEYRRALRTGGRVAALAVRWVEGTAGGGALLGRASAGLGQPALRQALGRLFDLAAPVGDFLRLAAADPLLGPLAERRPGLRLCVYEDPFEGLVRALLGQQVSVAAARTLAGRLVARFGEPAPGFGTFDGRALLAFPSARALAAAPAGEVRAIGLTGAKAAALAAAAEAVATGALDLERLRRAPAEAADAALRALPGVGPWTAAYVRMRALGDRDAFPAGDLGVVKALAPGPDGPRPRPPEVERRAEAWRPFRAYATLHLWASLGD